MDDCYLIVTIETTRLLFQRKAGSSFKDTRDLVTKLIRLAIETGAATLLQFLLSQLNRTQGLPSYPEDGGVLIINPGGSAVQLSMHASDSPFERSALMDLSFYSISRLYVNCLLATLNARLFISKDSIRVHQVSTILFDVPSLSGVSERRADYINVTISQSQLDMGSLMDTGDDAQSGSRNPTMRVHQRSECYL
ncbi:hypothetical protein BDN67DRAFT_800735 [Paxillus ammoniavirescens]|nr:hypothetical protein BDN67DRAFT_800735 [Paxillus ammoniavirescens]